MARARNIKPGFFIDGDLGELNPITRLLFAGLWCLADREGRLQDKPKDIKIQILPWDDVDIDKLLNELVPKFITRYEVDGNKYIQVNNFIKHQNPHNTEKKSTIPPFNGTITVNSPLSNGYATADSLNTDSLTPPNPPAVAEDESCLEQPEKTPVPAAKPRAKRTSKREELQQELYAAVEELTPSENVRRAARDWIDARLGREQKDWPSARAVTIAFNHLREWGYTEKQAVECFEESVVNGWKGLFRLRGG